MIQILMTERTNKMEGGVFDNNLKFCSIALFVFLATVNHMYVNLHLVH